MTLWLQGLFLFSLVWTIGGTITGDSRKKFDVYFRNLINGLDAEYPKPKSVKINKVGVDEMYEWIRSGKVKAYRKDGSNSSMIPGLLKL